MISLNRPWEHFVAQIILNQNVDFTIRIERDNPADPMLRTAHASSGSALERLFKRFNEMPVDVSTLKLPSIPPSVIEPSLLCVLENTNLVHGIPQPALDYLSPVARRYPPSPPDTDFEIDLLTSQMSRVLSLNEKPHSAGPGIDMPLFRNSRQMLDSIQDLPSVYRSAEIGRQTDLICGHFARIRFQTSNQSSGPAKFTVIQRALWQMVRLLLLSCQSNVYALDKDIDVFRKLCNALYESYALFSIGQERVWLIDHFKKIDNVLTRTNFDAGKELKFKPTSLYISRHSSIYCVRRFREPAWSVCRLTIY